MGFIYVYTNDYFNEKNLRKIGSSLNPFIRLNTYTTYFKNKGHFEFLFTITDDHRLLEIELTLKNKYLHNYNTKNNGSTGGTEIYENTGIRENIIKCFNDMNLNWAELDSCFPPITKKYINNYEREALKDYRKTMKNLDKKINYNKIVKKKLSKEEILKIILINNDCRAEDERTFCDLVEKDIKINGWGFETDTKNLGLYIIYRYSNNLDFIELDSKINENMTKHTLNKQRDLWLTLITKIPLDFKESSFLGNKLNNKWVSFWGAIAVFPKLKQTLYDGLVINNSISIFNLPIESYKCSITIKPPKLYGEISDLIINEISKVGTQYGYYHLPEIRKSKYTHSQFSFTGKNLQDIVIENLKEIVPNDKQEEVYWNTRLKYKVLEYTEGDFFTEHSDHKINKRHYGTLLIFPPSNDYLSHEGGNLIVKTDSYETVIPTSLNKDWKCIAFLTELKHKCYKILSGKRIVLKVELLYKKNYFNDYNKDSIVD